MARRALELVWFGALTGCSPLGLESGHTSIRNGAADTAHPEVGEVRENGEGICSGTLVDPRVVVSAKHCIDAYTQPWRITFALDDGSVATAEAFYYDGGFGGPRAAPEQDFLAIALGTPIANVAPAVERTRAMSNSLIGEHVTLVGYGRTAEGDDVPDDSGTRRTGIGTVSDVLEDTFWLSSNGWRAGICSGDSGGAGFLGGELAGVSSASGCDEGGSLLVRVDRHIHLLNAALRRVGHAEIDGDGLPDEAEGCSCDHTSECDPDPDDQTATCHCDRDCSSISGNDTCQWAQNGTCEEPEYCAVGTDWTDCDECACNRTIGCDTDPDTSGRCACDPSCDLEYCCVEQSGWDDPCGWRGDGRCDDEGCKWEEFQGSDPDCDGPDPVTCCHEQEAWNDPCGMRGDGECDRGCQWEQHVGADPDCEEAGGGDGTDTLEYCCVEQSAWNDPCGWRGDGTCDQGCVWEEWEGADPDCGDEAAGGDGGDGGAGDGGGEDESACCDDEAAAEDPCSWRGDGVCDAGCTWEEWLGEDPDCA